jgi:hypothetical protein
MVLGPEQPWKRLLAMIAFGAVGYVLLPLLLLLAVAQFGFHLWGRQGNPRVAQLADAIKALLGSILDFLLYRTDLLPYPFSSLPTEPVWPGNPSGTPSDHPHDVAAGVENWRGCLLHLGRCGTGDPANTSIAQAVRTDDAEILATVGIRPWTLEGEAHVAFAARNPALGRLFAGTRWQGRAWLSALKEAPDAVSRRIRIQPDANPRHAILLPLRLVLDAFDA